jgi:non-canonical purine NTP pyrophosphatase (RdgB/HAM1 family)
MKNKSSASLPLIFATNNRHKLEEVRNMIPGIAIESLADIGCREEIPETACSLEGNARLKATFVYERFDRDCFADDTGLEVEALGNRPGVHSARFSHEGTDAANIDKLLRALNGQTRRTARFRTVIALLLNSHEYFFEGIVTGTIATEPRGTAGFGYDPVFIPEGYDQTFAELGTTVKNAVSHRARAVSRLATFLTTLCAACLCLLSLPVEAQKGTWRSYPSYTWTRMVEETPDDVFVLAGFDITAFDRPSGALYAYGKDDNSVSLYTRESGLSDAYISRIGYSVDTRTLLLLYTNGNIDLLTDKGLYNIPHLLNNQTVRDKTVNDISFAGDYAFLAANFGIMVINLTKREITGTYQIGVTRSVFLCGDELIAVTEEGVYSGRTADNLLDKANWTDFPVPIGGTVRKLFGWGKTLVALKDDGVLWHNADGQWKSSFDYVLDIFCKGDKLIVRRWGDMIVFFAIDNWKQILVNEAFDVATRTGDVYWIAAGKEGLKALRPSDDDGGHEPVLSGLTVNGPKRDHAAFLTFHKDRLFVTGDGAGVFHDISTRRAATLMAYDGREWYNFDEQAIATQAGHPFSEAVAVAVDPLDDDHFFVATAGEGLFEFRDDSFVQRYYDDNSLIQSFVPASDPYAGRYVRTDGLAFDRDANLWVTNSDGDLHALKVRKPDGTWIALDYKGTGMPSRVVMDKILITRNNHKWVNIPKGTGVGILVVDEGATLDDTSDDVANFFASFRSAPTAEGQVLISPTSYYCMAEDLNGHVWIGTTLGPLICPNPAYAVTDPSRMYANRIVRTDADGAGAYFLDGEAVWAIAVDGGNRKWLGTQSSGLIVVSEDGQETVEHFTTANSPLPSNLIQSIAIHPTTGEVFIGTDKGIVSYLSGVTSGRPDYSQVTVFPNPVRPGFEGLVTVSGLIRDSYVRITDLNGHPLAEGKSVGGQFFWNARRPTGEPLSTGVYLVFSATAEAVQSVVAKIMVIR